MNDFQKGKTREEKINKFLDTLTWYFSEKETPTGFFRTIGRIEQELKELNKNISEASKSSDRLTKALNKITLAGVIIAGIGIIISVIELIIKIKL